MQLFDPRTGANRALLVGVSEYEYHAEKDDGGVPGDLPAVGHNLTELSETLRDGGVFGDNEVTVCRPAGIDDLDMALKSAAESADELLLFYFAGHGALPTSGDELWLQTPTARTVPGDRLVFPGALPLSQVLPVLAMSGARRIVVILDCCFAGNAARVLEAYDGKRRFSLLTSVQANHRTSAGGPQDATPFTAELVRALRYGVGGEGGDVTFSSLAEEIRHRMRDSRQMTLRDEPVVPRMCLGDPDLDVLLAAGTPPEPEEETGEAEAEPKRPWWRRRQTVVLAAGAAVVTLAVGGSLVLVPGDGAVTCAPPLELRLLTDPDLEPTVREAADTYLTSPANLTGEGCRRSGITVYGAKAADAVRGFRDDSGRWQEPSGGDGFDPQRDVGAQPDIWIPGSGTDIERARRGTAPRAAAFGKPSGTLARSPLVLAVPRGSATEEADSREDSLATLVARLREREPKAEVRRPDPEFTDAALLATVGLYGQRGGHPARAAERRIAQPGPPSPTGRDLLCELPRDDGADRRTAVLVPEHLLKTGLGCLSRTRERRVAEYPDDVPGLAPVFVPVRWDHADHHRESREEAVRDFRDWLTGPDGQKVFRHDGFRPPPGEGRAAKSGEGPAEGTLGDPGVLAAPAGADAMDEALKGYRGANGPGRVLFLLDSSGSMGDLWEGPGGAPGILKQSLSGLGPRDQYGVWGVASAKESEGSQGTKGAKDGHSELLPFTSHKAAEAERRIDERARVADAEADPYTALRAGLDDLGDRGAGDGRPQLLVFLTDGEDNGQLTEGGRLDEVAESAEDKGVAVVMASLDERGCDRDGPDTRIAEASGGRCLDTEPDTGAAPDLASGLRDEVARTGSGESG